MPFCRECGNEVHADWVTCPHCPAEKGEIGSGKMVQQLEHQVDEKQNERMTELIFWVKVGIVSITFSLLLIAMMVRRIPFAL